MDAHRLSTRITRPPRGALNALLGILLAACLGSPPALAYHYPWDQGHDTFDWAGPDEAGPCEGSECDPCRSTGSPVYIPTGHFIWTEQDVRIPGRPGLSLSRSYNSHDPQVGRFGNGWSADCTSLLIPTVDWARAADDTTVSSTTYLLREANGKRYVYTVGDDGQIESPPGRDDRMDVLADGQIQLSAPSGDTRRYNVSGRLAEVAAPSGESIRYEYDASGRLTRMAASSGAYLDFAYTERAFVSTITDSARRQWAYRYDLEGNLIEVEDPTGGIWQYAYQAYDPPADAQTYDQLTQIIDPDGVVVTTVTYAGARVASYTSGENVFTYDYDVDPQTVVKSDRVGSSWIFVYDDDGVITAVTAADGTRVASEYDDAGHLVHFTDEADQSWTFTYDEAGRRLSATDPLGQSEEWTYASPWPYPTTAVSPTGRTTSAAYDDQGNLVSLTDPTGATTELTWSERGFMESVRDALGQTFTFETNASGLPVSVTQPDGKTAEIAYDAAGYVVRLRDPGGALYTLERDALGRLLTQTDPSGRTLSYARSAAGRVLSLTDGQGQTTTYTYDEYGRLATETLSDGRQRQYSYRADNLLDAVTEPDGSVAAFTYDSVKQVRSVSRGGDTISYDYEVRGLLTNAENALGQVERSYDDAGRLLSETVNGHPVTYTYNSEHEVESVSALGLTHDYTRDARGLLTAITAPEGRYELSHDALGRRTALSMPHGQSVTYDYNAVGQPTGIIHSGPYENALTYGYDARGLMSTYAGKDVAWAYAYDPDGQLISASSAEATYTYQYDEAGNHVEALQEYDAAHRLLEDADYQYAYDLQGNLTTRTDRVSGETTRYTWNAWDQLIGVEGFETEDATRPTRSTTYGYGPLGRRWRVTEAGVQTDYVYDGLDRIAALDDSGTVLEQVTFGPAIDEPLAITTPTSTQYLHADHIGSIIGVSSSDGTVGDYRYAPFGADLSPPETTLATPFRFAGREDAGAGLYYNRARYYDSHARRFISEDPLGIFPGNMNLYAYAQNNPVHGTDPEGHLVQIAVPVYIAYKIGSSIYEAYTTASTILDPCSSVGEKWMAGSSLIVGAILPIGGRGIRSIARGVAKKAKESKRFSEEKQALVDMAKQDKKTGMTSGDMQAYKDLNKELKDPFPTNKVRGPEVHPKRPHGKEPHGHVGPVDHIPIKDK